MVSKERMKAQWGIMETALLTPREGLSELEEMKEMMYWMRKNNNAITTPSFDLEKNVCMKKL